METTICDYCLSTNYSIVYELSDYLLEHPDVKTTLVRCNSCGLIYQNPRPSIDEIGDHYPPEYDSYNPEPDPQHSSWLLIKAIHYGIEKRCRFITRYKYHGRLLDIGCSTGLFLNGMQQKPGWEVKGIEINSHAARIAREKYQLDVTSGTLESAHFTDAYFDAVTLWDVLEHLHHPSQSLQEIYRILNPKGLLVFRIPNGVSLDAKLFGPYWAGLDSPRHLYVFNPTTIKQLLEKNGFRTIDMVSGSGGYPSFIISVRLWLYAKGVKSDRRKNITRILSHPITRLITAPIFYVFGLGLNGSSLVVTAMKTSGLDMP